MMTLLGKTESGLPIEADISTLGDAVRVKLLESYVFANPVGFPRRLTGSERAIPAAATVELLECEAKALIAAGAAVPAVVSLVTFGHTRHRAIRWDTAVEPPSAPQFVQLTTDYFPQADIGSFARSGEWQLSRVVRAGATISCSPQESCALIAAGAAASGVSNP